MDFRFRIPGAIYRQAVDKAGGDKPLAAILVEFVTRYATGTTHAAQGGHARAASLTPTERHDIAKKAATARWGKHADPPTDR